MITTSERRALRARAHPLKPVVLLGQQGLTPAVMLAIDEALTAHELIKVRLRGLEKEVRDDTVQTLAGELGAEVINLIGHILTLYRLAPEPPPAAPAPAPRKDPRRKPGHKKYVAPAYEASPPPYAAGRRKPAAKTGRGPRKSPR
jgi:RNA-binding protein